MWIYKSLFCRLCGEGPIFGRPFCPSCRDRIEGQLLKPSWRSEETLPIFSLISWNRHNEKVSRSLLYDLKESRNKDLFFYWARWMVAQLEPELFSSAVLVPVPSSTGRRHSQQLSKALSRFSGAPVMGLLALDQKSRQSGKSRVQRKRRKLSLIEKINSPSYKTVILVDDVVTSGGTLLASQKALNSPKKLIGLTLLRRELSA